MFMRDVTFSHEIKSDIVHRWNQKWHCAQCWLGFILITLHFRPPPPPPHTHTHLHNEVWEYWDHTVCHLTWGHSYYTSTLPIPLHNESDVNTGITLWHLSFFWYSTSERCSMTQARPSLNLDLSLYFFLSKLCWECLLNLYQKENGSNAKYIISFPLHLIGL